MQSFQVRDHQPVLHAFLELGQALVPRFDVQVHGGDTHRTRIASLEAVARAFGLHPRGRLLIVQDRLEYTVIHHQLASGGIAFIIEVRNGQRVCIPRIVNDGDLVGEDLFVQLSLQRGNAFGNEVPGEQSRKGSQQACHRLPVQDHRTRPAGNRGSVQAVKHFVAEFLHESLPVKGVNRRHHFDQVPVLDPVILPACCSCHDVLDIILIPGFQPQGVGNCAGSL